MDVNTKRVQGRRELRFATMQDILADAEAVTAGRHRTLGNWTSAQIIEHLARFIRASHEGFSQQAPLWLRLVGRLIRNRALRQPLQPGIRPPGEFASTFMPGEDVTLDAAMAHLREAVRLTTPPGSMQQPSPLFGRLTHEQWVAMHCRHAEMHLSFIAAERRSGV